MVPRFLGRVTMMALCWGQLDTSVHRSGSMGSMVKHCCGCPGDHQRQATTEVPRLSRSGAPGHTDRLCRWRSRWGQDHYWCPQDNLGISFVSNLNPKIKEFLSWCFIHMAIYSYFLKNTLGVLMDQYWRLVDWREGIFPLFGYVSSLHIFATKNLLLHSSSSSNLIN